MSQTTFSTQSSLPLPDAFSTGLTALFADARPAIVQVHVDQRGGGTGIVWSADGQILTNNHVIAGMRSQLQVHFADGTTLDATILHRHPQLDLALLKVHAKDLPTLVPGDSDALRIGEWVFAIGHPWGQRWVVTAGIVSRLSSVQLTPQLKTRYIQSDVRLAPGNSGGPLLNAEGKVVGINAMIFGGDLSVAIPSQVVKAWLEALPGRRPTLGVELQIVPLPAPIQQQLSNGQTQGLLIVGLPGRQDRYTDLFLGDILLEAAGQPVTDVKMLRKILAVQEGKELSLKIVRGGQIHVLPAALLITD
ncbi:S1C family serine protease [Tengunoibacter tsumagoiensis]|uniref:PDZ domain-containing protein n=1 Tax=Tengunoibacter tsumagoiensis TaxID=2014871 RepID=A0A402A1P3_9CHLR|nr:trypsin-like peptidase domain-containing protein [Tengunoibacter tsumagoiensis]GCE12921.1 hypothetical protein KTT_27800 [Tengunoibacter tsumagoiensis]